jgi:aryl-alcohol dehydrogenase-like predicted oxidoreductase
MTPTGEERQAMNTRQLGQTGLSVTRLGLGLAALGRPGYINLGHAADLGRDYDHQAMQRHAEAVLDTAWDSGVRYFDAARSYGDAERFLASWLAYRGISRAEVVIGSKWGYTYTAGWQVEAERHEIKEHTAAVLRRQAQESRGLLGAHLQLYQVHSATLQSGVLDDAEVLAELARLREGGWKIGLSLTGPGQADTLRKALSVRVDGGRLFDAVQATWNLLEPSAGPALAQAHAAGMGVIVKEALANGRLTGRNDEPDFAPKRKVLQAEADRLGVRLDGLALAAVLAQPWADVVLSGAATQEQVRSNARALGASWDEEAQRRLAALAEPVEKYWRKRGRLAWN